MNYNLHILPPGLLSPPSVSSRFRGGKTAKCRHVGSRQAPGPQNRKIQKPSRHKEGNFDSNPCFSAKSNPPRRSEVCQSFCTHF
ncbi:hypothetical protein PBY51_018554 [Eleginops maclovinus]|uniref:Uncharacterized protein n=1 Tax=Eleginops maclovinus TaxID=56733 RepID=A0AAN8AYA6_ELEMC|nr:hypothetical protein PBY51_018554 [Eleginops maclovinus]